MLKRGGYTFVTVGLLLAISFSFIDSRTHRFKRTTIEGDIDMTKKDMKKFKTEVLFTGTVYSINLWKEGIVPYTIQPGFDLKEYEMLHGAMKEIMAKTCIQFVPMKEERNYIRFVKSNSGCSSYIGRVGKGKPQDIEMSPVCMRRGTAVHELIHALGHFHEQSRPDRDNYVDIVWENLDEENIKMNFGKYNTKFLKTHPLPYDYGSIMHYSSRAFAKSPGKTIIPKMEDVPIGQRTAMSHFDKAKINLMYNCKVNN